MDISESLSGLSYMTNSPRSPLANRSLFRLRSLEKIGGQDATRRPKSDDAHLILEWSGSRGDQRAIQAKGSFLHSGGRPSRIEHVRLPVKMRIVLSPNMKYHPPEILPHLNTALTLPILPKS